MKKTYHYPACLLLVFSMLIAMQSRAQYVFTPSRTLINYQNFNSLEYDSIHIANNSSDTLKLKWELLLQDTSGGTYFDFCSSGNCWLGIPQSGSFPPIVPGGWGYAGVHLWTGSLAAVSKFCIWVYKEGNYAAGDSLTFILHAIPQSDVKNAGIAEEALRLYPNPASDRLMIQTVFAAKADVELGIYNALGKPVYRTILQNENTEIPLAQYREGLYIVSLSSGKHLYTKKLLIAR